MASEICHLLLVALLAFAFVDIGTACKAAPAITHGREAKTMRYCPPEEVLFVYKEVSRCFPKCAECQNGFCLDNQCHCFPGTSKAKSGACGKICKNCEDGWCSSVSKCECDEDFIRVKDRCVHRSENCPIDYLWEPTSKTCIPYESAMAPDVDARMAP